MERGPKDIVVFTGLSASGKSSVAERLSQVTGAPVISLRQDVLHPAAVENGYTRARFWILATSEDSSLLNVERQKLAEVIAERSETAASDLVVVDDLIDPGTPQFLREFFNQSRVSVVLIKSNRHLRKRWIIKRMNASDREALEEQRWLDGIKIKGGIVRAIREADFRVNNMGRVEDTVDELIRLLGSRGKDERTDEGQTYVGL